MSGNSQSTPRVAAIVGPYLSGKTSLMESLLFVAGALPRKGSWIGLSAMARNPAMDWACWSNRLQRPFPSGAEYARRRPRFWMNFGAFWPDPPCGLACRDLCDGCRAGWRW